MRIFLTGATGFIGSAIIPELVAAGHHVLGLTRSDEGAAALHAAGVEAHRGTLEDPASLAAGAAQADGVIHTAFDHDFTRFVANCVKDSHAIAAIGAALAGTGKPLIVTSGTGIGSPGPGALAREDVFDLDHPNPRIASEHAGRAAAAAGAKVIVVRLPQVHDPRKAGLVTYLAAAAREKRVSAYLGDGANRWPAAHVSDVARLYRLAIEKNEAAVYHAVAEEGIAVKAMANVLGQGLGVPVTSLSADEAAAHFGFLAGFVGMDMPASSAWTRAALGWEPAGPGLIEDLGKMEWVEG